MGKKAKLRASRKANPEIGKKQQTIAMPANPKPDFGGLMLKTIGEQPFKLAASSSWYTACDYDDGWISLTFTLQYFMISDIPSCCGRPVLWTPTHGNH